MFGLRRVSVRGAMADRKRSAQNAGGLRNGSDIVARMALGNSHTSGFRRLRPESPRCVDYLGHTFSDLQADPQSHGEITVQAEDAQAVDFDNEAS